MEGIKGSEPLDNKKHEAFAQACINSRTQSDAYRQAFDLKKDIPPKNVWEYASRLANDINVSSRIKFLRKTLTDQCIWEREEAVKALKEIVTGTTVGEDGKERKEALAKDRIAAAIALNKMSGFDAPQQIELSGANGSPLGLAEFFKIDKPKDT